MSAMGPYKGLKTLRRIVEDCIKNVHPIYHIKVGAGWAGERWADPKRVGLGLTGGCLPAAARTGKGRWGLSCCAAAAQAARGATQEP